MDKNDYDKAWAEESPPAAAAGESEADKAREEVRQSSAEYDAAWADDSKKAD